MTINTLNLESTKYGVYCTYFWFRLSVDFDSLKVKNVLLSVALSLNWGKPLFVFLL